MARQNSIKSVGLRKHLDSTRDEHNGWGYDAFAKMMQIKKRPSIASMSRIFGVSEPTMQKWITLYESQ